MSSSLLLTVWQMKAVIKLCKIPSFYEKDCKLVVSFDFVILLIVYISVNFGFTCIISDVGFRVGKKSGINYLVLQVHYLHKFKRK